MATTENAIPQFRKTRLSCRRPACLAGSRRTSTIRSPTSSGRRSSGPRPSASASRRSRRSGMERCMGGDGDPHRGDGPEGRVRGHAVSAADAYLRASGYWRSARVFLQRADKNRIPFWSKSRQCFRAGVRLAGARCEQPQPRQPDRVRLSTTPSRRPHNPGLHVHRRLKRRGAK